MKPTPLLFRDRFSVAVRLVVGGVLVYAGFSKALAPAAEFAAAIENYKVLPILWLMPVATVFPWIELWAGLFLLSGLYTRWAALVATANFAVFATLLISTFWRGIALTNCGCFGAELFSPKVTLAIDSALLALLLVGWVLTGWQNPRWSLDRAFDPAK